MHSFKIAVLKLVLATSCGGELTGTEGTIESRNYPNKYPNKEDCVWIIKAGSDNRVEVTIDDLNIEFGGKICEYDFLKIYDGLEESDIELGRYCKTYKNVQVKSNGPDMRLHFKSDGSGNEKGFTLRWKIVKAPETSGLTSFLNKSRCFKVASCYLLMFAFDNKRA